jgi:hypothetical protein
VKLKSGEYDGTDIMEAWLLIEFLTTESERVRDRLEMFGIPRIRAEASLQALDVLEGRLNKQERFHAGELSILTTEVSAANARERPAFMAGWGYRYVHKSDDLEQAWQQYRCQDDSDWKAVDDETAAEIDAAVSGTPEQPGGA